MAQLHRGEAREEEPSEDETAEIERIRARLLEEYDDLLQPVPLELPPFCDVNHTIPIIDMGKRYNYHLPRCPEVLKPELLEKIERYTKAGWWVPCRTDQAAPLLCVYKKDGRLRTVVDLRLRNDNTVKEDRKSTRLNSSHSGESRMPSSA